MFCSPWGFKELDTALCVQDLKSNNIYIYLHVCTQILNLYTFLEMYGEGNGTPLQYSCLENPMDGGADRLQSMGSLRVGHD